MRIEPTTKRYDGRTEQGKGFILYGSVKAKWIEKWFSTKEDAQKFAEKRNWTICQEEGLRCNIG